MASDARDRITALYHAVLKRAPEERVAFLEEACNGDESLRQEVESLLRYASASAHLLETPAAAVGATRNGTSGSTAMIGRQLGPYTIVAPLGSGGMGEVYRARDTKLGRDVAIKILPAHFTADPERRARFAREARLLATLNHPNIGAIYGLEETDGVAALVLELVEGPTLADRLARGPLPIAEALSIARQIAEALDAAHGKGIVHRDLKPANIVLQGPSSSAGQLRAKVLDFGLAKTMAVGLEGDLTQPPDSLESTADGRILGTPAYMSPEQARGLAVDKRTDIWAFGCVLYEMLCGRPAFAGDTMSDIFVRILEHEPDWTALPARTPGNIQALLQRCLRKDPEKRLHDIADARVEIEESAGVSAAISPPVVWRFRTTAIAVLLGGAVGIWFVLHPAETPQLAVMPFSVLPESAGDADYLRVGIADAITTRLANTRQIAVRPTSAALRFKDAQSDPAQVASALGVSHLLLGSIQPAQDGYRISVQLVSADGVVVWGRSFHAPLTAVPQLHDDIAQDVLAALRVELSPTERARVYARYTDSPAAYEMYLRGRSLLVNYTEAKMREAIACFQEALRIDPTFARARAGIATASAWFSVRYSHEPESRVWGKRADEEARLALEQDGSLADAHYAIASAAGTEYGGFDWEVMLDRTATALTLDPSLDLAHLARMRVYYHLGLFDEARREGRLAHTVNPGPNTEFDRLEIAALLFTGQFDSAVEQATAHLPRTDIPAVPHYLGLAQYYAGDGPGARATLASITRHGRPDVRAQASLASIEAALGMRNEAHARLNDILRGSELDHHTAYSAGAALVQLGDLNAGLAWLERAAVTGFPCYPWYERDTLLDPLRRHPGFVQLLGRLRDGHEQARRRAR